MKEKYTIKLQLTILSVDFNSLKVKINEKEYDLEFYLSDDTFVIESSSELLNDFANKTEFVLYSIEKLTKVDASCKQYVHLQTVN